MAKNIAKKPARKERKEVQVTVDHAKKARGNIYWLLALLVITFFCFVGVLKCGFVNYDDEIYIKYNTLLRSFSLSDISSWFFTRKAIYGGNYHPLTTLTNAIEYSLFQLNPVAYHFTNLVMHLVNTILVFVLMLKLTRQNQITSFVVALLFGIHPMHVESVVWISERKDVLYAAFFLASIIQYVNFLEKRTRLSYVLCLVFFVLSLLSKSMAVTLPMVLLLIDYYFNGTIKMGDILRKVPHILLSLLFGLLAIHSQQVQGYIADYHYSPIDRFFLASYAWVYYIAVLFVPVNLSVLHPFPKAGELGIYYFTALIAVAIVMIAMLNKNYRKTAIFGLLFYTLTLSVVLQFVTVGAAIVSERYTYIPYIGLFYIIAFVIEPFYYSRKTMTVSFFVIAVLLLGYTTVNRLTVWKDGETLWRDATAKNPETADYAWYGLANILKEKKGDRAEIIGAYSKAIAINPGFPQYYHSRSGAKRDFGDIEGAMEDINKVIALSPNLPEAFYDRGNLYQDKSEHIKAILDFTKAISLKPDYSDALFNRAISYKKTEQFDAAIADYKKVLLLKPGFVNAYTNLGNIYSLMHNYTEALNSYNKSISLDPKQGSVFLNRAGVYINLGKKNEACADINMAVGLGDPDAPNAQKALCN